MVNKIEKQNRLVEILKKNVTDNLEMLQVIGYMTQVKQNRVAKLLLDYQIRKELQLQELGHQIVSTKQDSV